MSLATAPTTTTTSVSVPTPQDLLEHFERDAAWRDDDAQHEVLLLELESHAEKDYFGWNPTRANKQAARELTRFRTKEDKSEKRFRREYGISV